MRNKSVFKLTIRSIRSFLGRYMALLLIVALSVGFFAGLKITKDAMSNTAQGFLEEAKFYDFRLISTLGFSNNDVGALEDEEFVALAEGSKTADALVMYKDNIEAYKLMSLPKQVNIPSITAGRMPKAINECLADKRIFSEEDIGCTIEISDKNEESLQDDFVSTEYIIVGLVDSPVYLGQDRGSTSIGSGELAGFFYLPEADFKTDAYTEINLKLNETAAIYSSGYDRLISKYEETVTDITEDLAKSRYRDIIDEIDKAMEEAREEAERQALEAAQQAMEEVRAAAVAQAAQQGIIISPSEIPMPPIEIPEIEIPEIDKPDEPKVYVLTRSENTGYINFENDTSIISGIANIFPVFFILIAMLVCITTMTRMVDEERTQIGTLKALGYGNGAITAKYLLYAGSATLIGWLVGFFIGTWGLPKVFWYAYASFYSFAPIPYLFSAELAITTLAAALIGILGSAWLSCRKELLCVPAVLIRPKGAKSGRRIFLERITPLWRRFPFLTKVIIRNMFRYKRRLIMMLVGIGCCAGLVVTGFGVRDSMIDMGRWQFEDVQKYEFEAEFANEDSKKVYEKLDEEMQTGKEIEDYIGCLNKRVDLQGNSKTFDSVSMYGFASEDKDRINLYWSFHCKEEELPFPDKGEALISMQAAQQLSLSEGDLFQIEDSDHNVIDVRAAGIFDNYMDNLVIISEDTYKEAPGDWQVNTVLINVNKNASDISNQLTDIEEVTGVSRLLASKERIDSSLSCLNYIILLILAFSGALAFIVIFNLTNINLAERSREIATVEVLGFYKHETEKYVLHENLILSVIASFIGMPLGTLFHRIVMKMVVVYGLAFNVHITPVSYMLAFICTVVFAVIVDLVMKRQISKIKMAESLKAVE